MPLDADVHNRAGFASGVSQLDEFLKKQARKESDLNLNKTFVLTLEDEPSEIAGFYTLSATRMNTSDLPIDITKKLPRYSSLGLTLLGRFAIAEQYQHGSGAGHGLGKLLLTDAKYRTYQTSRTVASFGMVVDVLIGEKGDPTPFYSKHDFKPFTEDPSKLYLTMSTIEKTLRSAGLI